MQDDLAAIDSAAAALQEAAALGTLTDELAESVSRTIREHAAKLMQE